MVNLPREKTKVPQNIGEKLKNVKNDSSESFRSDLNAKLERVSMREQGLNTNKIINQNRLNEFKVGLMQDIFKILQDSGVDPSNLDSINQFLQELDKRNPDLRELFEYALNGILGAPHTQTMTATDTEEQPEERPNLDLTSKFSNLQENMLMPR